MPTSNVSHKPIEGAKEPDAQAQADVVKDVLGDAPADILPTESGPVGKEVKEDSPEQDNSFQEFVRDEEESDGTAPPVPEADKELAGRSEETTRPQEDTPPAQEPSKEPVVTSESKPDRDDLDIDNPWAQVADGGLTEDQKQAVQNHQVQLQQAKDQARERLVGSLANALDEDLVAELNTAPEKAIPKLHADLFLNIYEAVLQGVGQYLPQMIQRHAGQASAEQRFDDLFFKQFPELNRQDHYDSYVSLRNALVQSRPGIKGNELMRTVGASLMYANGIREKGNGQGQSVAEPAPYTPAAPRAVPPKTVSQNPFEQFAQSIEEMDGYED